MVEWCLAVIILLLAALLAGGIPARRAAQIDPMSALRHESVTAGVLSFHP